MSIPAIDLPIAEIADLCRKYHVTELALFGSALRDDFRPDGDVDLLVTFDENASIGLFEFAELQIELGNLIGRDVDLISRRGVEQSENWIRRREILGSSSVIYGS
jgi:predicted nucleotidyltransferase